MGNGDLEDAIRSRVAELGLWTGPVKLTVLGGGISNHNFIADDGTRRVVVRVGDDRIVHGVLRSNEHAASRAAHAAGISPAVVHAEPGILVLEFIEGQVLAPDDVRNPANFDRLVDVIRRCHREIPRHLRGPAAMFWVFHVLRDYAHTIQDDNSSHLSSLPDLLKRAAILEAAVGPIDVVFGHNDLLAANFMDDGKKLWLLDWEYSGFNSPLFDLGGLASNSEMTHDHSEALLAAYFGRPVDSDLRRRAAAMTAASLLREAMWSMVSEIHSTLDFDYAAYTQENLARFQAAFSRFETLDQS